MNLKNIIFFLGGGALGAVSTYLLMKESCNKLVEEETYNIKKYYEEKYADSKEEPEETVQKSNIVEHVPAPVVEDEESEEEKEEEPDYKEIIQKLNYNEFSTKVTTQKAKRPYLISEEDYIEDTMNVKKIISFFEEDEVYMDNDTKEVLDNVGKDIGMDNVEQLNMDGNEIYVRNEQLGIDYNIVSEPGSYEDFIDE